jgi:hypothetical protein
MEGFFAYLEKGKEHILLNIRQELHIHISQLSMQTGRITKLNNARKFKWSNVLPQTLVCFSLYHIEMKALVERPN